MYNNCSKIIQLTTIFLALGKLAGFPDDRMEKESRLSARLEGF
jgi:hypothetical protein